MVNAKEGSDCGDRKAHKLRVDWAVLDGLRIGRLVLDDLCSNALKKDQ